LLVDVPLDAVGVDDELTVCPHEICPVDGIVVEGHGVMDESYLTGEPFMIRRRPARLAVDSRYAQIMAVMRDSEQHRPRIRQLGDRLGAVYTPIALGLAIVAWMWTGDPVRFLAVLVVATPCPLLIGIPVAIIGAISLAAKRSIIIRDPSVLERIDRCRTIILDRPER